MATSTVNGSAYPQPVEALLPRARRLSRELGAVPSQNELKRRLRIGAPKAAELRAILAEEWPMLAGEVGLAQVPAVSRKPAEQVRPEPDTTGSEPVTEPSPTPALPVTSTEANVQATGVVEPVTSTPRKPGSPAVVWPVVLLALPAFVAIWSGWVGLGGLTGFGVVHPLPGIADGFSLNTAITLPIGVETYGAYALYVWLSGRVPDRARRFAKWSAIASLLVGALGQVAYHLLVAAGVTAAPWWITTAVACLPVAVLGMGAALAHLVRAGD